MRLFRDPNRLPDDVRHGAVTIGNFDGVHLGHARIMERLRLNSRRAGGPAVVFTFDPHPAQILRPAEAPPPLCSTERKVELLGELGADAVIAYPTDAAFLKLDAREFFDRIVRGRLDARALVEGPNFSFGRNREGNIDALRRFCREAHVDLEVVAPVEIDGLVFSSSCVRALLAEGEVDRARRMLTKPYRIRGEVIHGAGRGTGLGYPTANLTGVDTLIPADGIYAGRAFVEDRAWPAAISLGPNPTFDEGGRKVEVHLVDYAGQLYGREIELDFLARLRDIVRFASADQLAAQMDRDVAATRQIAARHDE